MLSTAQARDIASRNTIHLRRFLSIQQAGGRAYPRPVTMRPMPGISEPNPAIPERAKISKCDGMASRVFPPSDLCTAA